MATRSGKKNFPKYDSFKLSLKQTEDKVSFVKVNRTDIYLEADNSGSVACVGDLPNKSIAEVLSTSLKNNMQQNLGKIVYNKLSNIEMDLYAIPDSLIDMSTPTWYDPTLKINKLSANELSTKIRMYLPSIMPKCKTETILNINATGILKDFMANNLAVNDEQFLEEIIKIIEKRSSPLLNLELIKTHLVVQQWYTSTSRRIMDLQKSMGAPIKAADRPWPILWSKTSTIADLECFCSKWLQKPCTDRILRRLSDYFT